MSLNVVIYIIWQGLSIKIFLLRHIVNTKIRITSKLYFPVTSTKKGHVVNIYNIYSHILIYICSFDELINFLSVL